MPHLLIIPSKPHMELIGMETFNLLFPLLQEEVVSIWEGSSTIARKFLKCTGTCICEAAKHEYCTMLLPSHTIELTKDHTLSITSYLMSCLRPALYFS